jgi:hypothetical protein
MELMGDVMPQWKWSASLPFTKNIQTYHCEYNKNKYLFPRDWMLVLPISGSCARVNDSRERAVLSLFRLFKPFKTRTDQIDQMTQFYAIPVFLEARGSVVGWGTMLQARRSRVWFPMGSLDFSIDIIFKPHYDSVVGSASNRNEYQESSWGWRAAGAQGWQPYRHLWAHCLGNMGASTPHNPMGLHGPLQGQLYLFFYLPIFLTRVCACVRVSVCESEREQTSNKYITLFLHPVLLR